MCHHISTDLYLAVVAYEKLRSEKFDDDDDDDNNNNNNNMVMMMLMMMMKEDVTPLWTREVHTDREVIAKSYSK